ncbi:MAG TPA: peptide deformylase [Bacteroidota bacterium]|nr:peptide deformylase [Bacteroidota bacterium]
MATLPIYVYGNEVLKKKAKPVKEISNGMIQLIQDMFDTMRESGGIGLAANQVGVLDRIIVIDISDMEEYKDTKPMTLINPEIVDEQGEWELEEGCLSLPEIRDVIPRAEKITVKFQDPNLREQKIEAAGMLGRVLQHEIDHVNGVLITDHLSGTKRALLRSKLKKISKGDFERKYEVVLPPGEKQKKKK